MPVARRTLLRGSWRGLQAGVTLFLAFWMMILTVLIARLWLWFKHEDLKQEIDLQKSANLKAKYDDKFRMIVSLSLFLLFCFIMIRPLFR